jgi:transcriptional regulator with XRE-family HTH domain
MDIKSTFGENLKFYRKDRHLSQNKLSEQVGVSEKHLSAIERGLSFVTADFLEKVSTVLNVPVFVFFIQDKEFIYNDTLLESMTDGIDRIVEKHLINSIKGIQADVRRHNQQIIPKRS